MKKFDVLIIGSGPGGQRAAFQASKLKKRVAVIERQPYIGGAGLHTGTLPSKTLREAALFLAGFKQRALWFSVQPWQRSNTAGVDAQKNGCNKKADGGHNRPV